MSNYCDYIDCNCKYSSDEGCCDFPLMGSGYPYDAPCFRYEKEDGAKMNGLFLPDFKIPECCETCIANDDDWKCNVLDRIFDYDTVSEKRFDDCPLIEVEVKKMEVTE